MHIAYSFRHSPASLDALRRRVGSSRHQKRVSALHCWSTRDESPMHPRPVVATGGLATVFVGTITGLLRHNRNRCDLQIAALTQKLCTLFWSKIGHFRDFE